MNINIFVPTNCLELRMDRQLLMKGGKCVHSSHFNFYNRVTKSQKTCDCYPHIGNWNIHALLSVVDVHVLLL
jgi:hypothetical protein